ncbi:MAG: recombinase family protein, partial [Desulfovibrio sp.]|nr:recombinase family protein [Desulfovibrio sp.]
RLVVAKLDRLTRNLSFLCKLRDSRVPFVAVDNPNANDLTIAILVAVAEEERRLISQRTKAALAAARARGVRLGNPRGAAAFGSNARKGGATAVKAKAGAFAARVGSIILPLYDGGMSLRAIATKLNAERIATPRGGVWRACGVRRVIARLRPETVPEDAPEAWAPGSCTEAVQEEPGRSPASGSWKPSAETALL